MMKQRITILIAACTMALGVWADVLNYPLDTIQGKRYYRYTVERSIGLYRISKTFGVTQEQIIENNPQLKERGVHVDEVLRIPVPNDVDFVLPKEKPVVQPVLPVQPVVTDNDTNHYRLDVLLPFHKGLDKPSANENRLLDFYRGVIMAVYQTQESEGTRFDLYVHNSMNDTTVLAKLIADSLLEGTQGIIGPIYPEQVRYLSPWIKEHQIPTILPLDNHLECIATNPYLMQFNATPTQEASAIVEYIESSDMPMHCIFVNNGETDPSMQAIEQAIRTKRLSSARINGSALMNDSIRMVLKANAENIFIFTSTRYNRNKVYIKHLETLGHYKMSVLGTFSWQKNELKLPLIFTTTFTTSEEADMSTYEELWNKYFGFGHPSAYPRYDLLGYDITRRLITHMQNKEHQGLQSDIFFDTYRQGGGLINGHIEVIKSEP